MNLDAVLMQLRNGVPFLDGRIAGAAAFARGLEASVWMEFPSAFVVPLDETAEPNEDMNGLRQLVTVRIGVIVEFSAAADRRGQSPVEQYEAMRSALFGVLLNWRPDTTREARGFWYGGGRLLEFDRARLFYQWEFCLDETVTDADGWQPAVRPLTDIQATVSDPVSGVTLETFDTPLPQ